MCSAARGAQPGPNAQPHGVSGTGHVILLPTTPTLLSASHGLQLLDHWALDVRVV